MLGERGVVRMQMLMQHAMGFLCNHNTQLRNAMFNIVQQHSFHSKRKNKYKGAHLRIRENPSQFAM